MPAPTRIITSPRTGRLRIECTACRKIAYPSKGIAEDGAPRRLEAYLGECGHWHLATRIQTRSIR